MGFAFAQENKDKVTEIQVAKEANGTCVAPTVDTISDGSYPLSRSLYIYVNKAKAAANPAVVAFVDYYLAEGTISTVLETVPYVNLPADDAHRVPDRLGRREVASSPPGRRVEPFSGPDPFAYPPPSPTASQESPHRWHRPPPPSRPASRCRAARAGSGASGPCAACSSGRRSRRS